jgi:hypothetical protein
MIWISGPCIAALRLRSRMTENTAMRGGAYGPSVMIDGARYVRLDEVERRAGLRFSREQLMAAQAGLSGRMIAFQDGTDDGAVAA